MTSVGYERARLRVWPAVVLVVVGVVIAVVEWRWATMPPVSVSHCQTITRSWQTFLRATIDNSSSKQLRRVDVVVATEGLHNSGGNVAVYSFWDSMWPHTRAVHGAPIYAEIEGDWRGDSRRGRILSCDVISVEFYDGTKWHASSGPKWEHP